MFKRLLTVALPIMGVLWFFMPKTSLAFTATLVSITPDATDISDQLQLPEMVQGGAFIGTDGEEYEAVFTVDEEPAIVVMPGGRMDLDNNWSYDSTTGQVTVNFTATGMKGDGPEVPEGSAAFIIAMMAPVEEGQDGPPSEMIGAWLSTNVMEWELVPPSEESPYFGFKLSGPSGETGFFNMFIPAAIIELLSEYSGLDLSAENMAVFEDNDQSSLSVTDVDGAAYIEINITFSDEQTTVSAADTNVTKEITAGAKLPVSLAASKYRVAKGNKTKLYGWLRNGKEGETVTVWRKLKGEDDFTKVDTLTTKADGYFSSKVVVNKTAKYKMKYKRNKGATAKESPVQQVTVK